MKHKKSKASTNSKQDQISFRLKKSDFQNISFCLDFFSLLLEAENNRNGSFCPNPNIELLK